MRGWIASVSFLLLLACGGARPSSTTVEESWERTFVGTWRGVRENETGLDEDGWPMVVEIEHVDPGPCGSVTYPTRDCRGLWICQPGYDGDVLQVRERITHGAERCVDGGSITVTTAHDGTLEWRYAAGDARARASLSSLLSETPAP